MNCPCGAPLPDDGIVRRETEHGPIVCSDCWRGPAEELARAAVRQRITWRLATLPLEQLRQVETLADMLDAEQREPRAGA